MFLTGVIHSAVANKFWSPAFYSLNKLMYLLFIETVSECLLKGELLSSSLPSSQLSCR